MKFSRVIELIKQLPGSRFRREGWNGKGMWVTYSPGSVGVASDKFWAVRNRDYAESKGGFAEVGECLTMKAADGVIEMGWRPTSRDMFATDWEAVPENEE